MTEREAFELIALPNFRQPISKDVAEDHWQTWQEACTWQREQDAKARISDEVQRQVRARVLQWARMDRL